MQVITNNQPRTLVYLSELSAKERAEFDYLNEDNASGFFRYKGRVYDLGEFMRIDRTIAPHPQRPKWENFDGYSSDSFFSGLLVKYCQGFDSVIVARFTF